MKPRLAAFSLMLVSALAIALLYPADDKQERLARHINLGKAFYENPATTREAVDEFRQALALEPNSAREHLNYGLALLRAGLTKEGVAELGKARSIDPSLPHPYFNLGVVFKKDGDFARALRELQQMTKLAPSEAVTHYNLGVLYKQQGQIDQAVAEFETSARLDPTLAAPHFQLFNAYRTSKRADEAQRELAVFKEIKNRQSIAGTSEDMDWCYYAEILDNLPQVAGATEAAAPVEVVFEDQRLGTLGGAASSEGGGVAALDADGNGKLDLLAWSAQRVILFRNTGAGFSAVPVAGATGPVAIGDFNNDGLPDFCALTRQGPLLFVNRKGTFASAEKPVRPGAFRKALWVDFDHDYDLDLMLLGSSSVLLRNNGDGTWTDLSSQFPFVTGEAIDAAVLELGENNGFDIVIAYRDRPAVLYRDKKIGRYEAVPLPFSLSGSLVVGDFNQDGFLDLASVDLRGSVSFIENRRGALAEPRALGSGHAGPALFADFQNRGRLDLLAGAEMLFNRRDFSYEPGKVRGVPVKT
ncbi:MAG: VCBS repeat-containing protein, partial [Acidobacteria bacterium]|nr:VCBS repeat-containing protein [Acidobacteriota bacterium]